MPMELKTQAKLSSLDWSARREASAEFKPLLAVSLAARQGHYKCQMLHSPNPLSSPSLSLPACLLPLTLMLMLNWCAECVERFCYMWNAICKCVPHTHTATHLYTCWAALICIDSRTLETLISWASARSQCDGCTNLCLHSHNILFIKINDFDLTYNPSHAHTPTTHTPMPAKVEASPNENWILVNKYAQMHPLCLSH